MKLILSSLLAGTVFGLGLGIAEMTNPARVIGFLDIAGVWDPTLGLVLGAALAVGIPGFALVRRRREPLVEGRFQLPTRKNIDAPLIAGAVIFGVGWGIAGLCPGPAFAALSTGSGLVFLFVAAMLGGMFLHRLMPVRE
jgi:hypothetical protein